MNTVYAPRTARARIRAEITREIVAAAHEELVETGPAALSLRSVARRLEMAPSALYRYFDNRDALLTALIIGAYEALGAAAEEADQAAGGTRRARPDVRAGPGGRAERAGREGSGERGGRVGRAGRSGPPSPAARWRAVTRAIRDWGHAHPHEWALLYGSPVPGYRAPQGTVAAALRVTMVITGIIGDAVPAGPASSSGARSRAAAAPSLPPAPAGFAAVIAPLEEVVLPGRSPEVVAAALVAWTQVIGMVSLELFGHYVGGTTDFDAAFDYAMAIVGSVAGVGDGA